MASLLALAVAVLALSTTADCSMIACPLNSLQFISFNRTLIPTANVVASSEDNTTNPTSQFVMEHSQPWCSAVNEGMKSDLHINLTFTEPVVITFLESGGFFNAFVEKFSLEFALGGEGEDFLPYGVLNPQQIFTVKNDGYQVEDTYFSLEQPLVVQKLKLNIHQSVLENSNRACWSLKMLGCTFQQAVDIVDEMRIGSDNTTFPEGCMSSRDRVPATAVPEATDLPSAVERACDNDSTTAEVLTLVLPIALFSIVACAVIVGIGVLSCYIIVSKSSQKAKSKYDPGYERVKVKMLGRRRLPVPDESVDGVQSNRASCKRKDSMCSNDSASSNFHYDMPRPLTYDVPRTPSQRQHAGTTSTNEYHNPLYDDGFFTKESNTYESIPESLNRLEQRMRTSSDILPLREVMRVNSGAVPLPEKKSRRASEGAESRSKLLGKAKKDVVGQAQPPMETQISEESGEQQGAVEGEGEGEGDRGQGVSEGDTGSAAPTVANQPSTESVTETHKYAKVDKTKKNKEGNVPVFEVLYETSSSERNTKKQSKLATS